MPANSLPSDLTPPPAVDTSGADVRKMSCQQIMPLLHRLEPGQFTQAAQAFKDLGTALENIRANIEKTGNALAENRSWRGTAAQNAMKAFQEMHDAAALLAADSAQAGKALHWFGGEATPPFQSIPDPQVLSGWKKYAAEAAEWTSPAVGVASTLSGHGPGGGQDEADRAARGYMNGYNRQIAKLNQALPAGGNPEKHGHQHTHHVHHQHHVHHEGHENHLKHEPNQPVHPNTGGPHHPGGGNPAHGPNPFARRNPPDPPGKPHVPAAPRGPETPAVPETPHNRGQLQALNPPHGGGTGTPPGSGGTGPAEVGAGQAGARGAMMSSDGPAGEAGAGTAAAEGRGGGYNVIPQTGAGTGGQQDKERQRQAWISEDKSVWGVPDEDVGPEIG